MTSSSTRSGKLSTSSQSLELPINQSPSPVCSAPISIPSDIPTHPVQIALRTYALSLFLSLGPSLVSFVTPFFLARHTRDFVKDRRGPHLVDLLKRELGFNGLAFAVTVAAGGGAALRHVWDMLEELGKWPYDFTRSEADVGSISPLGQIKAWIASRKTSSLQKTFLSNVISSSFAVVLLQVGRRSSKQRKNTLSKSWTSPISDSFPPNKTSLTLDLTLLLLVRALDAVVQSLLLKRSEKNIRNPTKQGKLFADGNILRETLEREERKQESNRRRHHLMSCIDALVFWGCSARIMWCFFYEPQRLPRSYVKWIGTLANVDSRLLQALRGLRSGQWSYFTGSPAHSYLLTSFSRDLGYPPSWGDPALLPANGGRSANATWQILGVKGRKGVGGLPCELVHGNIGVWTGLGNSCVANTGVRFLMAFLEAIAIYLPAHLLPILLVRPHTVLRPRVALSIFLAALRSATFLSVFVSSFWLSVCTSRTLVLARLFPQISHNFWDGPYGCMLAGCLTCGSSIWIENGRRTGEMALYVLPRAIRACLPNAWVRSRNKLAGVVERIVFVISLASLLTTAVHRPDSLRGLSRWTLAFITHGPNTGFWKRKQYSVSNSPPALTPAKGIPYKIRNSGT